MSLSAMISTDRGSWPAGAFSGISYEKESFAIYFNNWKYFVLRKVFKFTKKILDHLPKIAIVVN